MTMSFASELRTSDETVVAGDAKGDGERITIRVQMPEVWDVVRVDTGVHTTVSVIKDAALLRLFPDFVTPTDFLLKLNGFEVLDESVGVADAGARDGSTFLLTFRRRRPVR